MRVEAAETSSSSPQSTLLSITCAPSRASPITAPAATPGTAPATIPMDSTPASGQAEPSDWLWSASHTAPSASESVAPTATSPTTSAGRSVRSGSRHSATE